MNFMKSPEKRKLIRIGLIALALDFLMTAAQLPFLPLIIQSTVLEEIVEQILATVLAGSTIRLTLLDRMIGFLPIPGVNPITVHVVRKVFLSRTL